MQPQWPSKKSTAPCVHVNGKHLGSHLLAVTGNQRHLPKEVARGATPFGAYKPQTPLGTIAPLVQVTVSDADHPLSKPFATIPRLMIRESLRQRNREIENHTMIEKEIGGQR